MSRFKAFGIHFAISLLIFLVLAQLIVFVWYPEFFFRSDGGWQGLRIIVAVDLVLGPLLTFIVFKPGKPGLKFDLTMIGLFQTVCLAAGIWVVYMERPIAMVYVDGYFYSMSADSYLDAGIQPPDLSQMPGSKPVWVKVELPEDVFAQSEVRGDALRAGRSLATLVDRYVPFGPNTLAATDALNLDDVTEGRAVFDTWLADNQASADQYRFYPFGARYTYGYLAFDVDSGQVADLIKISVLRQEAS